MMRAVTWALWAIAVGLIVLGLSYFVAVAVWFAKHGAPDSKVRLELGHLAIICVPVIAGILLILWLRRPSLTHTPS